MSACVCMRVGEGTFVYLTFSKNEMQLSIKRTLPDGWLAVFVDTVTYRLLVNVLLWCTMTAYMAPCPGNAAKACLDFPCNEEIVFI